MTSCLPKRNVVSVFVLLFFLVRSASAQLRVVEYNTAGVNNATALETILQAIGDKSINGVSKPIDVLLLQEQNSVSGDTQTILNGLNAYYGAGTYVRSALNGASTGAGTQTLIYDTHTVQLIGEKTIGTTSASGAARVPLRYEIRPVGYDSSADIFLYNSHYKASDTTADANRRDVEAQAIRADAATLGGADIIYVGDFNIYRSSEPMWATLTAVGNGQAFDPINRVGAWHDNTSFKDVDTQSPVTSARYSGQTTGGMDDRFDFQLTTASLLDGTGNAYISGSYQAFGNNGTHAFNGEITTGTGASPAILTALTQASDHLPVVAQYQVPAMMGTSLAAVPAQVIVGAALSTQLSVTNTAGDGALVTAPIGADTLHYNVNASGAATGATNGTATAFAGANVHSFALDTSTAGAKTADFTAIPTSQQVPGGSQSTGLSYTVLDHATASFDAQTASTTLNLDFGTFYAGSGVHELGYLIGNLLSTSGLTAGLDLESFSALGDAATLDANLSLFQNLVAGASQQFSASFATSHLGTFSATYDVVLGDDANLLGAVSGQHLALALTGATIMMPGDANIDGIVNGLDIALIASHWLETADNLPGDLNDDGIVNGLDISAVASNWGQSASGTGNVASAVPEPGTLILAAVAIPLALAVGRRRTWCKVPRS